MKRWKPIGDHRLLRGGKRASGPAEIEWTPGYFWYQQIKNIQMTSKETWEIEFFRKKEEHVQSRNLPESHPNWPRPARGRFFWSAKNGIFFINPKTWMPRYAKDMAIQTQTLLLSFTFIADPTALPWLPARLRLKLAVYEHTVESFAIESLEHEDGCDKWTFRYWRPTAQLSQL